MRSQIRTALIAALTEFNATNRSGATLGTEEGDSLLNGEIRIDSFDILSLFLLFESHIAQTLGRPFQIELENTSFQDGQNSFATVGSAIDFFTALVDNA